MSAISGCGWSSAGGESWNSFCRGILSDLPRKPSQYVWVPPPTKSIMELRPRVSSSHVHIWMKIKYTSICLFYCNCVCACLPTAWTETCGPRRGNKRVTEDNVWQHPSSTDNNCWTFGWCMLSTSHLILLVHVYYKYWLFDQVTNIFIFLTMF